jgi:glycosyltransferase involved in cell wall biosynthesis
LEAYISMDVVLLPSKHEGNPLTILESMACAKPVIGTKVGGIEETIKGGGGFLFESGDTVELNRIINVLKNNKEYCREVGQEGLEKVEKTYSVDKVINKYLDVYNSILKK